MKTSIDIPDDVLRDAMHFSKARTKRDAIVTAVEEFNARRRMAELVRHAGTCADLVTADVLQADRRRG